MASISNNAVASMYMGARTVVRTVKGNSDNCKVEKVSLHQYLTSSPLPLVDLMLLAESKEELIKYCSLTGGRTE